MLGKIKAAKKVTAAGIPMVIASGKAPDTLIKLFNGENIGTYFMPGKEKLASRKCWIAFTLKPQGTLWVDDGAAEAIVRRGKSLLPSGIVDVGGNFGVGASVEFKNGRQQVLGRGLVNYSSLNIRKILGLHSSQIKDCLGEKPYDEVVHRDNLVVFDEYVLPL
jgi:glutamate 5-kinase